MIFYEFISTFTNKLVKQSLRVTVDCSMSCLNYWNWAWTGFHNSELKWNVIPWNAKHCFQPWIFCEHKFTDPSLLRIWYTFVLHTMVVYWKIGSKISNRNRFRCIFFKNDPVPVSEVDGVQQKRHFGGVHQWIKLKSARRELEAHYGNLRDMFIGSVPPYLLL